MSIEHVQMGRSVKQPANLRRSEGGKHLPQQSQCAVLKHSLHTSHVLYRETCHMNSSHKMPLESAPGGWWMLQPTLLHWQSLSFTVELQLALWIETQRMLRVIWMGTVMHITNSSTLTRPRNRRVRYFGACLLYTSPSPRD